MVPAQVTKTVNCTAGNLSSQLTAYEKNTITNLTITGTIDARDFKTMRDSLPVLKDINIGETTIQEYDGDKGTTSLPFAIKYPSNEIPEDALKYQESLSSIVLPTNIVTIGKSAFEGCFTLSHLTIPSGVSSIQKSAFENCSMLKSIILSESIKEIEESAFEDCRNLSSIILPNSLTNIAKSTFENCIGLISITIPSTITTIEESVFEDCRSLASIIIPSSVTTLGKYVFENCRNLTEINIPSSVTKIGSYAFKDCRSLNKISLPSTITSIGKNTFEDCRNLETINIPEKVTLINNEAFIGCRNLTSLTLAASTDTIENDAFVDCSAIITVEKGNPNYSSLNGIFYNKNQDTLIHCPTTIKSNLVIPKTVTTIGKRAFENCNNLDTIKIHSSVKRIKKDAFKKISGFIDVEKNNPIFSSIDGVLFNKAQDTLIFCPTSKKGNYTIPSTVRTIGKNAFNGCAKLSSITILASVNVIENDAFTGSSGQIIVSSDNANYLSSNGVLFNKSKTELIHYPKNKAGDYSIPSSVTTISKSAFEDCSELTNLTMTSSVNSIMKSAFENCYKLSSIFISSSLTQISPRTFEDCQSLSSFAIPTPVKSIGDNVFQGCTNLRNLKSSSKYPIYTGSNDVFYDVNKDSCILEVPYGAKKDYQNATQWKNLRIVQNEFGIDKVIPDLVRLIDQDTISIEIKGYRFNSKSQVYFEKIDSTRLIPYETVMKDSMHLSVKLALHDTFFIGKYDVVVVNDSKDTLRLEKCFYIEAGVNLIPYGEWIPFKINMGNSLSFGVVVPTTENLFVFVRKSNRLGYSDTWNGSVKLTKDGRAISQQPSNSDFAFQLLNPKKGLYAIELLKYNRSELSKGEIMFTNSPPELKLNEWSTGEIFRPYGQDWKMITIPENTTDLSLQTEGYGMWSTIDVYFDSITNNKDHWQFSNMGAGYQIKGQIHNPKAGTYYIKYTDSAVLYDNGSSDQDTQRREYMIFAGTSSSVPSSSKSLSIEKLSTYTVGQGIAAIDISGTGFSDSDIIKLVKDSKEYVAETDYKDIRNTTGIFNLASADTGKYELKIIRTDFISATANENVVVKDGTDSNFDLQILTREKFRTGRFQPAIIRVTNIGNINKKSIPITIKLPVTCKVSVDDLMKFDYDSKNDMLDPNKASVAVKNPE